MTANSNRARGFSMVELMVSIIAGLLVSGAALTFVMSSFRANGEYVLSTRLTQELRNSLDLAVRDLQRAGYDDNALTYLSFDTNNSPFAPILLLDSAYDADARPDCAIYAYDRTYPNGATVASGTAGAIDLGNGEVRGLRRVTATVNGNTVGIIEYAVSAGTTKPACGDATADYTTFPPACVGTWCPLSDPTALNITALVFTDNGPEMSSTKSGVTTQMAIRRLDVGLSGQLAGNTEFTRDVRTIVQVRADCIRQSASFANCEATP